MRNARAATQNKELLQQIFAEMAKGNSRPLVESMADDFSWTVSGTTKWSRTYAGKQSVSNERLCLSFDGHERFPSRIAS